ncbi:MAG: hypothetical protein NC299_17150 [Lachnospiraceae bacterium]|nr:hypothetical protein [Ruminococcus sp.]MCM1277059.1 hypothetical protein [Lachnospiraceae bacterium]
MKITVKLSAESLRKAAAEVRAYKARIEKLAAELTAELAAQGAQIALVEAGNIRMTGTLLSSIVSEFNGNFGFVKCKCGYAVYVEFGTGVVGKAKKHPDISIVGWSYDVNSHGELGWWYPTTETDPNPYKRKGKDGKMYAWTKGMPSRPFMYNTARELRRLVIPTARGLIS